MSKQRRSKATADDFANQADEQDVGLLAEFVEFLRYNKKWWIAPIIIVLILFGILIMLGGTALAPFIYPLI